jgi:hypothetical protein
LATRYSQNLDRWHQQSIGINRVSKADFFSLFEPAFQQAFTPANIHSAFTKTGLQPFNPDVVLSGLRSASSSRPTTATSSDKDNPLKKVKKEVRFIQGLKAESKNELGKHQQQLELTSVKNCLKSLAAENAIQKTEIEGLKQALFNKQDKGQKKKTFT